MPPYADAIASFWKGRLAGGSGAVARPAISHLLRNASMPLDLGRTRAQAASLAAQIRGDGRQLLLLPGLLASEHRMEPMRAILEAAGYRAHGWGMGRNFGPRADTLEQIDRRVDDIRRCSGDPVTLIGWSLGGLFAREYAKFARAKIGGVVTMGTPFPAIRAPTMRGASISWCPAFPWTALHSPAAGKKSHPCLPPPCGQGATG